MATDHEQPDQFEDVPDRPSSESPVPASSSVPGYLDRPSTTITDLTLTRAIFESEELAIALSHFDLGVIHSIRPFRRGSRRSPKVLLASDKGLFILKRRAPGRDEPERIAFTHEIQQQLARKGFPLPKLIPTRDGKTTALHLESGWYELFEYIRGTRYDQSLQATLQAGQGLALFHHILASYDTDYQPMSSGYHAQPNIPGMLAAVPQRVGDGRLASTTQFLRSAYSQASDRAEKCGLGGWPIQVIHGDWHPGNMLYHTSKIVAVIDYDTARYGQRILDFANGALQFSVTRSEGPPEQWPDYLDESRLKRFCRGYDLVEGCVISTAELDAMPHLMIEALIAESAHPIATTGRFASIDGGSFLRMVERKVRWLQDQADHLKAILA